MHTEPYFMSNKEWYYHDEKEFKYKLTDKAPEEAKRSYDELYNNEILINGEPYIIRR